MMFSFVNMSAFGDLWAKKASIFDKVYQET